MGASRRKDHRKELAIFLAGILTLWSVQRVANFVEETHFRFDRIEQYLSQQEMLRQMGVQPQQAPAERSHKGELSEPQRWKV